MTQNSPRPENLETQENPDYLSQQLITYLGNKRSLLGFIGQGLKEVQTRLGKEKLRTWDVFTGSGVVARYLKAFSSHLYASDLEPYAALIARCYLSNLQDLDHSALMAHYQNIIYKLENEPLTEGLISRLYAPQDDQHIQSGERVFYTRRNAQYLDTARQLIAQVHENLQCYFLAPLLAEASVHANTSGVFKGFYKDRTTGLGKFGGQGRHALSRITGPIQLPFPLFSRFSCESTIYTADANQLAGVLPEVDLAYLDPPYNQHPYGSNYFMLNTLVTYQPPQAPSRVSGIPADWNRSAYNQAPRAAAALEDLVKKIRAPYLLISFNSEGFIPHQAMVQLLESQGRLTTLQQTYNTFRGSRNLRQRPLHVQEYLYLLEKK